MSAIELSDKFQEIEREVAQLHGKLKELSSVQVKRVLNTWLCHEALQAWREDETAMENYLTGFLEGMLWQAKHPRQIDISEELHHAITGPEIASMVLKRINSDRELIINDPSGDDDGEAFEAEDLFSRMVACALLEVFPTRKKDSYDEDIGEGKYMQFLKAWDQASEVKHDKERGQEFNFAFKAAQGHRNVANWLTEVKKLLKNRTDLGEVAMSLIVREYNLFGTFEHVDRALGRSTENLNAKTTCTLPNPY